MLLVSQSFVTAEKMTIRFRNIPVDQQLRSKSINEVDPRFGYSDHRVSE